MEYKIKKNSHSRLKHIFKKQKISMESQDNEQ